MSRVSENERGCSPTQDDTPGELWAAAAAAERITTWLDSDPPLTESQMKQHEMASEALMSAASRYAAAVAWAGRAVR